MYLIILVASVVAIVTIARNVRRGSGKRSADEEEPIYAGYPQRNFSSWNEPANIDKDVFYLNLKKTIHWTDKIVGNIENIATIDYSRVLRTVNPVSKGRPLYSWYSPDEPWIATPLIFNYPDILDQVMNLRNDTSSIESPLAKGKILAFEIDITTHDGAPVAATSGFVDESDIPPIDTWFFVTDKYLYCWIPALFIGIMQDAIEVEIFGSYNWLEDVKPDLNALISDKLK
jgi:hypothetical protein